jgi:hypothetical protein
MKVPARTANGSAAKMSAVRRLVPFPKRDAAVPKRARESATMLSSSLDMYRAGGPNKIAMAAMNNASPAPDRVFENAFVLRYTEIWALKSHISA